MRAAGKTVYIGFGAALRPEGRAWRLDRAGRGRAERFRSLDGALRSLEREAVREVRERLARVRAQVRREFRAGR